MAKLTWDELGQCETSDDIAGLLESLSIKGVRSDPKRCPLANATGWTVDGEFAFLDSSTIVLTDAEFDFQLFFDDGAYSELEE